MASGESSETLEYQTCVLRVSIHCEGCKKKVKKVLGNIDGVREAHIDSQLNKVTVVSNVGADALIKKLNKAGKPAELWPEKKPTNPNPNPNPNSSNSNSNSKNKNKSKGASKSNNEPAGNPDKAKDGKANVEVPNSDDTEPTQPEAKEEEAAHGAAPEDGEKAGGSGSKKKGKKEGATGEAAAITEEITENAESPRHHRHLDEHLAYTPQPVSAYNMAHPTSSNSYYYSPAPMPAYEPQAYTYSHPPPESYYSSYPPAYPHVESYYTQPETGPSSSSAPAPAGSYDMFSDENANSCKVM